MSSNAPKPIVPGLQYPTDINTADPIGFALKNVFDNLFYLRSKLESNAASGTLSAAQIVALVSRLIKQLTPRAADVIVGTHAERITTYSSVSLAVGLEFFETDRIATYIISDASGSKKWVLVSAAMNGVIAARPTDLSTVDAGFFFTDTTTDQETEWMWDGSEWLTIGGYLQEISDVVTNTITTVQILRHLTSGAAAAGYGIGQLFQLENDAGTTTSAARWSYEWSDASAGTEDTIARLFLTVAGGLAEVLNITSVGLMTLVGKYVWKAGTNFTGTLNHANTGNRIYTFADADGNIVYETAVLTNNNFLFGGGGALAKDAGFGSPVPVANGGTGANSAAGARANLSAAQIQAPGAHTITLAKITGAGANGSLTWNSEGVITGYVDPT